MASVDKWARLMVQVLKKEAGLDRERPKGLEPEAGNTGVGGVYSWKGRSLLF